MTKIRNNSETIYQSKKKQMLIMMKNVGNTSGIVLNTQLLKKKYYTEKINNLKIL